ncbi:MAG: protein-disulfide reductase DsbD family protein [Alphaproteobacteria bacterium]|nr:protein-disulfide reductase DsbD family protein [Alphaproteobacteria bacterium]
MTPFSFANARTRLTQTLLGAVVGIVVSVGSAVAQEAKTSSGWLITHFSQVRMIAATAGGKTDGTLTIGFHARLDPGWHIYWRTPGETGLPTQFDFSNSQNVSNVAIDWPAPIRASLLGYNAWVYSDEVVLPMTVTIADPDRPVRIEAAGVYAICKNMCTFHNEIFVLNLPARARTTTPYAALIGKFGAQVPSKIRGGSLDVARMATSTDRVTLEVTSATPLAGVDAAVEGPLDFVFGFPAVTYGAGRLSAVLEIPMEFVGTERTARADLVVTVMDGDRAIERRRVLSMAR